MEKAISAATILAFAGCAALISGCANLDPKENVIFFTKTSLGIDVDGTPPEVSLAYNRQEGFMGPRYDNGAVPPVASHLSTDGGLFSRNVKQFYATGNAALALTRQPAEKPGTATTELSGGKKAMFFGTSTTTGIRISFAANGAEGFVFGYRRKELSYIPVGTVNNKDTYASVIGVYTNETQASSTANLGLGIAQYFATGAAADNIASWESTRSAFQKKGEDAFGKYDQSVANQDHETVMVLRCFAFIDDTKLPGVLKNASDLGLFQDDKAFDLISKEPDIRKRKAAYVDEIGISAGRSEYRSGLLTGHRVFVCDPKNRTTG